MNNVVNTPTVDEIFNFFISVMRHKGKISIMNTQMKKDWIKTVCQKRSKKVRRK